MNKFGHVTSLPRSTSFSDEALQSVYLDRLKYLHRNTSLKSLRRVSMLRELHDMVIVPAFEIKDDAIIVTPADVARCVRLLVNAHFQFSECLINTKLL